MYYNTQRHKAINELKIKQNNIGVASHMLYIYVSIHIVMVFTHCPSEATVAARYSQALNRHAAWNSCSLLILPAEHSRITTFAIFLRFLCNVNLHLARISCIRARLTLGFDSTVGCARRGRAATVATAAAAEKDRSTCCGRHGTTEAASRRRPHPRSITNCVITNITEMPARTLKLFRQPD